MSEGFLRVSTFLPQLIKSLEIAFFLILAAIDIKTFWITKGEILLRASLEQCTLFVEMVEKVNSGGGFPSLDGGGGAMCGGGIYD